MPSFTGALTLPLPQVVGSPWIAKLIASTIEGDSFWARRRNSTPWDDGTIHQKRIALQMATFAFEMLNYKGSRTVVTQTFQFPRNKDAAIPQDYKDACCLEAREIMDGRDIDLEQEGSGTIEDAYGNIRTKQDASAVKVHIQAGILSPLAWKVILPYLRDPHLIELERVS